jgi:hypothetical protein
MPSAIRNQAIGLGVMEPDQQEDNEIVGSAQLHNRHVQEAKSWVEKEINAYKGFEIAQREAAVHQRECVVARREAAVNEREDAAEKEVQAARVILEREEDVTEREKAMDAFEKWLAVEEARAETAIGQRALGGLGYDDGYEAESTMARQEVVDDNVQLKEDKQDATATGGADRAFELEDTSVNNPIKSEDVKRKDSFFVLEEEPFPGFSWASQGTYSYQSSGHFIDYSDARSASLPTLLQSTASPNILDDDISVRSILPPPLQPGATHLPRHVRFDLDKPLPRLPNFSRKQRAKMVYPRSPAPAPMPTSPVPLSLPITFSPSTEFLTLSDVESESFPSTSAEHLRRNYAFSSLGELGIAVQKQRRSSNPEKTLKRRMSFADLKKGVRHG